MNSLVAITGTPNSGKTTLAVKLALALHQGGKQVLVVFCSEHLPPKAYLCNTNKSTVSLGQLLTAEEITNDLLLKSMTAVQDNLAYIGYNVDDTDNDYPYVTKAGAARLLNLLADFQGTVIFDCSNFTNDIFSQMAILRAEKCIVTLNADVKSAVWYKTQSLPKNYIAVLNDIQPNQPIECFDAAFHICHAEEIALQFETQKLWKPISEPAFCKDLNKLLSGVFV